MDLNINILVNMPIYIQINAFPLKSKHRLPKTSHIIKATHQISRKWCNKETLLAFGETHETGSKLKLGILEWWNSFKKLVKSWCCCETYKVNLLFMQDTKCASREAKKFK